MSTDGSTDDPNAGPRNPFAPAEYAKLTGFEGRWRDTWWREDFLALCFARRAIAPSPFVLDVGCGAGHWGRTLLRVLPGAPRLAGVDIEQDFVDRATQAAAAMGLSADYAKGAVEKLPYPDDHFDIVTCQTVMIHVRSPERAVDEMRRVLRPGGLLLLAEPNNVVGYLSYLMAEPRPSWSYIRRQLDFYQTCLLGKKASGMGDSSIGDTLPALLAAAGLCDVDVCLNESCPALVPPYVSERQQIERDFVREHIEGGSWWMGFGPRDNTLRFYLAGGGRDDDFDAIWREVIAFQKTVADNIDNGTYSGGRGAMMYLVAANKRA